MLNDIPENALGERSCGQGSRIGPSSIVVEQPNELVQVELLRLLLFGAWSELRIATDQACEKVQESVSLSLSGRGNGYHLVVEHILQEFVVVVIDLVLGEVVIWDCLEEEAKNTIGEL